MKTAEEILAEASTMIAHIHNRTGMYVGSTARPGAADTLDAVFGLLIGFGIASKTAKPNLRGFLCYLRTPQVRRSWVS